MFKTLLNNKLAAKYLGDKVSPVAVKRDLHYVVSDDNGTRSVGKNRYNGFCYREIESGKISLELNNG